MTVDYESLETHLGNIFRMSDNYDLNDAHFFPVGFLDRLFHFAQDLSVVENRRDKKREILTSGDDFDRWVDDMIATASVQVRLDVSGSVVTAQLIDIASLQFEADGTVKAEMVDGNSAVLMADESTPMNVTSLEQLTIDVEQAYSRQSEPLGTLEYLASMFYRASKALKVDISNDNRDKFIEPVFRFFKFDLIPMIPDLQEDLEQIADERLLVIRVVQRN